MKITYAESIVMRVLWDLGPAPADRVVAELAREWSPATVKTLLNRLLKKSAIKAEKDGRRYIYSPLFTRNEYVFGESQQLIDRFLGGKLSPLVTYFSQQQKLSAEDIEEIKRIIEEVDNAD